jgi:catechol 2,3-dioxygenase-like lactoylglutathione lyase family enzyme
MTTRLDHANIQVRDIDGAIRFLGTALADFRVRGEGRTWQGQRWVHVGNDDTYINLTQASREPVEERAPYSASPGLNHLGFEVDDIEALRTRMKRAGYFDTTVPNDHPHRKRVYFQDAEGHEWEFIQYLSSDRTRRNDYDLPDTVS